MASENKKLPGGRALSRRQFIASGVAVAALPLQVQRVQRRAFQLPAPKRVYVDAPSPDQIQKLRAVQITRPSAAAMQGARSLFAAFEQIAANPDMVKRFVEDPRATLNALGWDSATLDRRRIELLHERQDPLPDDWSAQGTRLCATIGYIYCVIAGYGEWGFFQE
jgi:hypothetical protein